jgi:hypothetical protein
MYHLMTTREAETDSDRNEDSSVCVARGYGLNGRVSIPGKDEKFSFTPQLPDRLWSPPTLLSIG